MYIATKRRFKVTATLHSGSSFCVVVLVVGVVTVGVAVVGFVVVGVAVVGVVVGVAVICDFSVIPKHKIRCRSIVPL